MASETIEQLLTRLRDNPEREAVVTELEALQSIYSEENAITPWAASEIGMPASLPTDTIRVEIRTTLSPPHGAVELRLLASLPRAYPASTPPQLQILSRYIGAFQVDTALFGKVLKTYISSGRVSFVPGEVCMFDGIENVREEIQKWYEDHVNAGLAAQILRQDQKEQDVSIRHETVTEGMKAMRLDAQDEKSTQLPAGIEIFVSDPVVDRKSTFVGRACRIAHPSQVPVILAHLLEDKNIARATHPVINAWRCEVDGNIHHDNDDDGETAAGSRLAHLLQMLDVKDVLVVVTRHFGGIHLHGDRFRHITNVARAALDHGNFLDVDLPDDPKHAGRAGAKGKQRA